jgi:peptidyl-dipeptidase Dcp
MSNNPLLRDFDTPFGAPPFDKIRPEHFPPAFDVAFAEREAEIAAIVGHAEGSTFQNTIEALEYSGLLLKRVKNLFSNLRSANTNEALQVIARDVAPRLIRQRDDILLNGQLFRRVQEVWEAREELELTAAQHMLLEDTWKDFVCGGAALGGEKQSALRAINEELARSALRFSENVLAETNAFILVLQQEADLVGLPEGLTSAALAEAIERGENGKWVFTLDKPSWIPFLQYSDRRDLRERMYQGYVERCDHNNEHDNKELITKMAALRARRARLLGYATHAHSILDRNMAETPARVQAFLERLWRPSVARAESEVAQMQALIDTEGGDFKLAPWDWWYYAEKVRKAEYDFDEEALKPYFSLENVRRGAFEVARRLFGLEFKPLEGMPVYHQEVEVFEVKDHDGSHLGLFYTDFHPRPGKRVGAWMDNYRDQWIREGTDVRPHIVNVCNFVRPTGSQPALLSWEEVLTLFHEFGHALHGMLSRGHYPNLSGTGVPRDFVEFPSQVLENWAAEPEVLALYARHYETDEVIPKELVDRLEAASLFNQGFATTEYLAASFLDLAWHGLEDGDEPSWDRLEDDAMKKIGLPPQILPRYRSTYFSHVFGGGYSAGYYSYIWAAVLDADAFQAFKDRGLFDADLARGLRQHVLEQGYSEPPMILYKRFRGAEPVIGPLLERRGLMPAG